MLSVHRHGFIARLESPYRGHRLGIDTILIDGTYGIIALIEMVVDDGMNDAQDHVRDDTGYHDDEFLPARFWNAVHMAEVRFICSLSMLSSIMPTIFT